MLSVCCAKLTLELQWICTFFEFYCIVCLSVRGKLCGEKLLYLVHSHCQLLYVLLILLCDTYFCTSLYSFHCVSAVPELFVDDEEMNCKALV